MTKLKRFPDNHYMEITSLSAAQMAQRIRTKEISPVELLQAHLARIEKLNPRLNAYINLRGQAVPEAKQAEAAVMSGDSLGPLHGVPISIKSAISLAGSPWETGSRLRAGVIADKDAPLVARLKAAGAIVLGATNVPEMLMAYETDNLLYGRSNNPWDLERTPGGSSGGESAAIAACISAGGVGSDGGGSVRVPAHFCGICGLKPTPGRIPATGHYPESLGPFAMLGVVGPMARTVRDVELMFVAMAGPDPGDTFSAPVPLRLISQTEARRQTIGYFEDEPGYPVTPETRAAVLSAANSLKSRGYEVVPFRPSMLAAAREFWWTMFVLTGAEVISEMCAGQQSQVSPIMQQFLTFAANTPLTKEKLLQAWFGRDQLRLQLNAEMEKIPIFLSPVCAISAFRHGEREWQTGNQKINYLDAMAYTQWFNLLGNPAAVVPVGQSPEGLPIGVQIVGRPYDEELVLQVAADVEEDFGYRPPPLTQFE